MADPGTGLVALGIALGGKDVVIKLLGPTADYLGGGFKDFTQRRVENVKSIFSNASKKLGDKIEIEGGVSPRVLKGILEDGSFAEDSLAIDYFGGVLASSRTSAARDDRGAYFNSIISRLSVYQLRFHYLAYHMFKMTFDGESFSIGSYQDRIKLRIFIPLNIFEPAMAFSPDEMEQEGNLTNHILFGLKREDLLGEYFTWGGKEGLQKEFPDAPSEGIIIQPTVSGIDLFLWAYGKGQTNVDDFLSAHNSFKIDESIRLLGPPVRVEKP